MTVNILDNIRRIGVFMIAAQTMLHFAAGKQYEKYMKVITGVIILLMFIGPFVSGSEVFAENWQTEYERIERQIQMQSGKWQEISYTADSLETAALRQIEEEIRSRLDESVAESGVRVTSVTIDLEETDKDAGMQTEGRSFVFRRVKVTVQDDTDDPADLYNDGIIKIEEITIGQETEADEAQGEGDISEQDAEIKEYQHFFAQTLGIADDRVEVTYRGGR